MQNVEVDKPHDVLILYCTVSPFFHILYETSFNCAR